MFYEYCANVCTEEIDIGRIEKFLQSSKKLAEVVGLFRNTFKISVEMPLIMISDSSASVLRIIFAELFRNALKHWKELYVWYKNSWKSPFVFFIEANFDDNKALNILYRNSTIDETERSVKIEDDPDNVGGLSQCVWYITKIFKNGTDERSMDYTKEGNFEFKFVLHAGYYEEGGQ